LLGGFQGKDDLCLTEGCYAFKFTPSGANAKPAWALGDPTEGGVVFSGAHEADCAFSVGGAECPTGGLAKQQCGLEGKVTPPPTAKFTCPSSEALLVLRLTDSWGDGWNGADISVVKDGNVLYTDTLQDGAYKEYNHCLKPGCYAITTTSGEWREEVTWQAVEQMPDMSIKALNSGAAPETCGIELVGSGASSGTCDAGCSTLAAAQDDWTDGQGDDAFWGADAASLSRHRRASSSREEAVRTVTTQAAGTTRRPITTRTTTVAKVATSSLQGARATSSAASTRTLKGGRRRLPS